jgi:exodeoxyribonuclease VII small subunit
MKTNVFAISEQWALSPRRTPLSKPCFTARRTCSSVAPVPKPSKAAPGDKSSDLSFEEALQQLEAIVEQMESDELPLESLLTHYEQGTKLAAVCQKKLAEAELKIQKLEKNAAGELELQPFPLEDEAAEPTPQ